MKLNERKLTKAEVSKREDIIMDMKKNKRELTKRYGKDAEKVMYGRATNLAKKQLENMDPKSKLREMIKTALQNPKKADLNKDGKLSDYEKKRGAAIEKSIIDEIEVDDSYSERETMEMEYNQNPEKFLDSIVSILNRFSNDGTFTSSNVDDNYLNTFELEGSPLKVGLNKEFSFDLLSGGEILMSNKDLDTILLASQEHSSIKEDKTLTPPPISLVNKRRAKADMKQFTTGKRADKGVVNKADGTKDDKYNSIILGVEKDGNQTQLKTLDDFDFTTNKEGKKIPSNYVEYYLADYNYKTNSYKIPKYQNVKEDFRVEYKTQDGENAKSRIYKTKEEAEKKEAELVDKSRIKQAKIVNVGSGLKEDLDLGHQDDEPHMLKANLYRIGKYAMELYQMMDKFEGQGEVDLPHWWQSKIIKSESMITSAKHYLDFELKEPEIDAMVDVASEEGAISENKDKKWSSYEQRMVNQIKRALKDKDSIFKLPIKTQEFYRKNKDKINESKYSQLAEKIVKNLKKKALNEDVEEWPKEHPSRYDEYKFELDPTYKGKPGQAKYKIIDIKSGKLHSLRTFMKIKDLMDYADDLIKPQGGTQSSQFEESLNEDKDFKKGDKLKIKLKNGKEFNLTFDSYMKQKGMAFGKFKNKYGEFDTKTFSLDTIINESLKK